MASQPADKFVAAPANFRSILFATDFSSISDRALKYAVEIAARNKSELFVVHALPPGTPSPSSDFGMRQTDGRLKQVEDHVRALENSGVLSGIEHQILTQRGSLWDVLEKVIKNKNIDLIVLGTHGRGGIKKLVMGSVAEEVLRLAPCPVLTIGSAVPEPTVAFAFRRVLFTTDFSTGSLRAFSYATSFSELVGAKLILLHVLDPTRMGWSAQFESIRAHAVERLKALIPPGNVARVEVRIQLGSPGYVIVASAHNELADLIIMGAHATHAVGTSTHLPWTVAHHVVCQAHCPVLTVLGQTKG